MEDNNTVNNDANEYKAAAKALDMEDSDMQDYMSLMKDARFRELMDKIEEENRAQAEYVKKQYTMSKIGALASVAGLVVIVVTVLVLVPQILVLIRDTTAMVNQANIVIEQINEMQLIEQLSQAVSGLQGGVDELAKIDVETLNQAISDLASVVEPMAKFFGR
ncbi:MAG: hypothetical protein HUJ71_05150 [Pseudobutyrivibrio sp.]|nr:hypothetical protein [Pseudobutyrivibrio sp.]